MKIFNDLKSKRSSIALVGLGYVGLPLAVAFGKKFNVIGVDIKKERIEELDSGHDSTGEVTKEELAKVRPNITFTTDPGAINRCSLIIVTVPTPTDQHNLPDLSLIRRSSEMIAGQLKKNSVIVYESTVYPGVVEDICVPIIEKISGLKWKKDFYVGYSPERINPGDKKHSVTKITKVVSGDTRSTKKLLARIYGEVIEAGIFEAASIKVAEAAKVIENTQRDLNIALMNELAQIFHKMDIDTTDVLEAAGTKWNFLKFTPGLVGGHCIGVDPYYLTFKAEEIGYHPQIILAGRRINDHMSKYIVEETVKLMIRGLHRIKGCRIGILGITFKENVPDIRNSKVIDIIHELKDYEAEIVLYDPVAGKKDVKREYGLDLISRRELKNLNAIIVAVAHDEFKTWGIKDFNGFYASNGKKILIDIKSIFGKDKFDQSYLYWRL